MSFAALVARYGYLAIFAGTFFEGETVLLLGGLAAHQGYLDWWGVVAAAWAGSVAGDQLYFQLGRHQGPRFVERHARWKASADRARRLLRRHETGLILGFRFLYGLRIATPLVLGASGVPPVRFALLNALSGAVWTIVVASAGYGLGSAAHQVLGRVERYEAILAAVIVLVGAGVWITHWIRSR